MKVSSLLVIAFFFNASFATAYPVSLGENIVTDSISLKAKKLKQYYLLSGSTIYQKKFFAEFPNTFKQLNELYGDDINTGGVAILYEEAVNHIEELFNNLNSINDTLYYRKIVRIAKGGHWDADAINYFQHGLRNRVESKPGLTVYLLQSMNEKEVESFWYFYFDGPHPKKRISESLQKIKSIDVSIYDIMLKAQGKVLKNKE